MPTGFTPGIPPLPSPMFPVDPAYASYPSPPPPVLPLPTFSPHHSGLQQQNPKVQAWIKETPLPTSLAFQTADPDSNSSDEDGNGRGGNKRGSAIGGVAAGSAAPTIAPGRSRGVSGVVPFVLVPKTSKKKKSARRSRIVDDGVEDDTEEEDHDPDDEDEDFEGEGKLDGWVNPVGNGVIYYDPSKPAVRQESVVGPARKKAGAVSSKELKALKDLAKRQAELEDQVAIAEEEERLKRKGTKSGEPNGEEYEVSQENGGEQEDDDEEDERESMADWLRQRAQELATKNPKPLARQFSRASNAEDLPLRGTSGLMSGHVPATLSSEAREATQKDLFFLSPGRSQRHRPENDDDSGTSEEEEESGDEEESNASDYDSQYSSDMEQTTERLISLGLGPEGAGKLDDRNRRVEDEDEITGSSGPVSSEQASESISETAASKAVKEGDFANMPPEEVHYYLEVKRIEAKQPQAHPEKSFDAARCIIAPVQYLTTMPEEQKSFCEVAVKCLKRIAAMGSSQALAAEAQHLLANLYISGIPGFQDRHKPDYTRAFALYASAAKKDNSDALFHVGLCYEQGAGVAASFARAVHNYKKAALANHPGAMFRLGMALLHGELHQNKNPRDGVKWLRLAAKYADERYPQALYELAMLHDKGVPHIIWTDHPYLLQLLGRGAELGHAMYPARSVYYYSLAAANGNAEAMFELGGWYLTGASDAATNFSLPQSDTEARHWVSLSAEEGLPRALFAMGYFIEMGIGASADADTGYGDDGPNPEIAMVWYRRAAEAGDPKAIKKLQEKGYDVREYIAEGKNKKTKNADPLGLLGFSTAGASGGVSGRVAGMRGELDEELDGGNKCLVM
ncbi:hypothetical protein HDU76_000143 [Blyttiomyces sp. JEL0837]|nr:hypothetical protein HDU76_000143 [Blyttiomyces sp. JEL0837]